MTLKNVYFTGITFIPTRTSTSTVPVHLSLMKTRKEFKACGTRSIRSFMAQHLLLFSTMRHRHIYTLALLATLGSALETASPPSPHLSESTAGDTDPSGEALITWIRSYGGVIDGLELRRPISGPRGVFTSVSISKGGPMYIVPDDVLIHRTPVMNASLNPSFHHRLGPALHGLQDDFFLIAIYLAHERFYNAEDSPIRPYLNVLPAQVNVPLFWSPNTLLLFNTMPSAGKDYERYVLYKDSFLQYVREKVAPQLPEAADVLDRFLWGFSMVKSRAWGKLSGATNGCTLVPFADLFNHRSDGASLAAVFREGNEGDEAGAEQQERERIGTGMEALRDFEKGEEVYDTYSPLDSDEPQHCNSDMLLLYGFLDPNPRFDCFRIRISLNLTDAKMAEEKADVIRAFNVSCSSTVVLRGGVPQIASVDHTLLICFRVMFIDKEQEVQQALQAAQDHMYPEKELLPAWSLANEYQALKHLIATLRRTKEGYPSSAEEDARRLYTLSSAEVIALVDLRRREQQTLDVYIQRLRRQWAHVLDQDITTDDSK